MAAKFCGMCGTPASGGRFCEQCGAPYSDPGADRSPQAPERETGPAPTPAPTPAPQAPHAAPLANPFAGVDLADVARDVGAVFFLFGGLLTPWSFAGDGAEQWWVVLATVVSLLVLPLPYLLATRVVPGLGAGQVTLIKLLGQVPVLVSVLVAVIVDLVHLTDSFEGGIGAGVGLTLAGALLAAQPRRADEAGSPTGRTDTWFFLSVALPLVGIALLLLGGLVGTALGGDALSYGVLAFFALVLIGTVSVLALVVLPLVGHVSGAPGATRLLATVGLGLGTVTLFATAGDDSELFLAAPVTKLLGTFDGFTVVPTGQFLVVAGAAAAVSRSVLRRGREHGEASSWVATAASALRLSAVVLAVCAVGRLLVLLEEPSEAAASVAIIVLTVLAAAAALVGSLLLPLSPSRRVVGVAVAAGVLVLAVVVAAVLRSVFGSGYGPFTAETLAWFVLPGLALWALLVPAVVRRSLPPVTPEQFRTP